MCAERDPQLQLSRMASSVFVPRKWPAAPTDAAMSLWDIWEEVVRISPEHLTHSSTAPVCGIIATQFC